MEKLEVRKVNSAFWNKKKVYLTGHTGFKGSWLAIWLQSLGAEVGGYALKPLTNPSMFVEAKVEDYVKSKIGDIRDLNKITNSMTSFNPDVLIHLAAQPLVRLSYSDPVETYSTNVMGTVNVLEAARKCSNLRAIVCVTTDKCYENKEWDVGYRENDPMGGHDPYSSSKGCAELVISAYRRSYFNNMSSAAIASARAGNVIGGGDWTESRLIPDILDAFEKQKPVVIRNPESTRPWQHVLDPLSGYLLLAEDLYQHNHKYAEAFNFGPNDADCRRVDWILDKMINFWGSGATWVVDKNKSLHEAKSLKLDCSKAKSMLGWKPNWNLETTLKRIIHWHLAWRAGNDMYKMTIDEIEEYSQINQI